MAASHLNRDVCRLAVLGLTLLMVQHVRSETSRVIELTQANFEEHVGQLDNAMVEFYAPWCGHCKRLAPEYEKLALMFRTTKDLVIAKVDCDAEKDLCQRFAVGGFPTIKWFPAQSTTPEDYSQQRSLEPLVEFINKKLGTKIVVPKVPSDVVELNMDNFDEVVLDREKHVLVEFYAPWCGHCKSLAPTYERVASIFKKERDVVVAKVDSSEHKFLAQRYKVSGYPTVWWFPKSNKDGEEYEAGRELGHFVNYLNSKLGTFRAVDGGYNEQAGRNASLDALAQRFMAEGADRAAVLAEAQALAGTADAEDSLQSKGSALYVKVMQAVLDPAKGEQYVDKESARLKRMLAGDLKQAKKEELTIRSNVVAAFLPPPPPPAAAEVEAVPASDVEELPADAAAADGAAAAA
eukprot:TRINITY_DN1359_c0_g3_i1.p1 TRINITY_DN1359_c0_g3~~TRINITY_DN1359_c0_g3_i1.p1  ORF type:complete len:425 (+),score=47.03 TRINITY_DN1359_c0_g3_i1:56-1276(+)